MGDGGGGRGEGEYALRWRYWTGLVGCILAY